MHDTGQVTQQCTAQRIAGVGAVEGDGGDAFAHLEQHDVGHAHMLSRPTAMHSVRGVVVGLVAREVDKSQVAEPHERCGDPSAQRSEVFVKEV